MTETALEQRARVLSQCDDSARDYDLALALGYKAESWDGMWKLPKNPFTIVGPFVLVRECVTEPDGRGVRTRMGRLRRKYRIRLLPR